VPGIFASDLANYAAINFLGELQSADILPGSWSDVANFSPYRVPATNAAKFYRAAE
jgi:hypothetical protein